MEATRAFPPVRALNRLDFPALGRPTRPRRSIGSRVVPPSRLHAVSKRTKKAKTRAHRNKANHGRKPNRGR